MVGANESSPRLCDPRACTRRPQVMVFIDGTWLYYTLFERGRRCPINAKFGFGWQQTHTIDFSKLPQIISDHISQEGRHPPEPRP
eukprot:2598098-Prymnesium_polylepis.1